MTATTANRNTQVMQGILRQFSLAAGQVIPAGVLACVNAAGLLVNGSADATLRCVGITRHRVDATGALDGQVKATTEVGVFGPFANSAGGDQLTTADCTQDCYIVDNQTVAKTNGGGARPVAGKVWCVTADGVWVNFLV